jgi:hypothetical protein
MWFFDGRGEDATRWQFAGAFMLAVIAWAHASKSYCRTSYKDGSNACTNGVHSPAENNSSRCIARVHAV